MIKIFYSCHRNAEMSANRYIIEYPDRQQPHSGHFSKLDGNLVEYGVFYKIF